MPNVFEPEWEAELPAPWNLRGARVGQAAGARRLGATVYEIAPGGVVSPLHTHAANQEMVIALSGPVTLRIPESERVLEPGELVACPVGRPGAHQLRNRGTEPARVLVLSEMRMPEVAEHLDSGKVLVFHGTWKDRSLLAFSSSDAVPQMTGEPGG